MGTTTDGNKSASGISGIGWGDGIESTGLKRLFSGEADPKLAADDDEEKLLAQIWPEWTFECFRNDDGSV